jgi:hypothetical protein
MRQASKLHSVVSRFSIRWASRQMNQGPRPWTPKVRGIEMLRRSMGSHLVLRPRASALGTRCLATKDGMSTRLK